MSRTFGRNLAKAMVLTPHQPCEPWWRLDFVTYDVHELVEWAFRQWQIDGLVCKFKATTHAEKLPVGSKPRYMLTWQARLRLFGRGLEIARLREIFLSQKTLYKGEREVLPAESSGALVQALSEMMSCDDVNLCPCWEDEEFYAVAEANAHCRANKQSRRSKRKVSESKSQNPD